MADSQPQSPPTGGVLFLYTQLWSVARGSRAMLAGACILLVAAQLPHLAAPYVAAKAINAFQIRGRDGLGEAGLWLIASVLLAVASWTLHGPGRVLERNVSLRVRRRISTSLLERVLVLPLSWHEANHSGATAHRIQQSSHALTDFAESQFIYLNSAVKLIGPIVALWLIQPVIGLAAIAGFAVISASVLGFDRTMMRLAREENDAERNYAATLVDTLGNATTLFALRQARRVITMLEGRLEAVFKPLRRSIVINEVKWLTVDLATRTLSCVLVALFAWRITHSASDTHRTLLLGSLYMVWEYAGQAGGVIAAVAQHFQTFARQQADYRSADVIRDASPAHFVDEQRATAAPAWQRLDIHDLCFRHATSRSDSPALDRLTLSLESGKRYALIGASGSGKSTLLRVLAGLYPCERLTLRSDSGPGIVSPADAARFLRATATLIPQDAEVFSGTLSENLSLCESVNGAPSPADYLRALELARANTFIEPGNIGLEAQVAERAANWSGGQRSRIALARGILAAQGSSVVLLDEPTAHLDTATEAEVYANLFACFAEACLVSAVHRLHLLDQFDEVLLLESGRLVAQGTPAALSAGCPQFQALKSVYRASIDAAPAATSAAA